MEVITERAHLYKSLGDDANSLIDHQWVADHTKQAWLRKNSLYSIAGIYKNQKQYAKCKALILQITDEFPDDTAHKWWLRDLRKKMR